MTGRLMAVSCAAALAVAALVPAFVAAEVPVAVGDAVLDPKGDMVGTIKSTDGGTAVVWTGTMKVTLGLSSFRMTRSGLKIGMTREQLEAAAADVQSRGDEEVRKRLVAGAEVRGSDGAVLATVETVENDMATLVVGEAKVRYPMSAFSIGRDGVRLGSTAAELDAAIKAQSPAPSAKAPGAGDAPDEDDEPDRQDE